MIKDEWNGWVKDVRSLIWPTERMDSFSITGIWKEGDSEGKNNHINFRHDKSILMLTLN